MKYFKMFLQAFQSPLKRKNIRLVASGASILLGWFFLSVMENSNLGNGWMVFAAVLAGYDILVKAIRGLRNRQTNIELLVSIAAIGGLSIGIYWESAAVTFLFLIGGWMESRTLSATRKTLKNLIQLAPEIAFIVEEDELIEMEARKVEKGQLVLVKPGGRIPVDGQVESGRTTVDESSITGESIPAEKQENDFVFAGTINQNGRVYVRAEKAGGDTTLAKIIRRVEEAQEAKAPTQRFIERFASWYTPSIVVLSVISFIITQNIELAITLLVIGCPGALVISTPVSVITGISRAAKEGILIKGGEFLENVGKITALAFDKTGTLTQGKPQVTEIFSLQPEKVLAGLDEQEVQPVTEEEIIYWAGIAESSSEHPLAEAIMEEARKEQVIPNASGFYSHTGFGVEAEYEENRVLAGNVDFMQEQGISVSEKAQEKITELTQRGRTLVLVAKNEELLGGIGISDTIRPDAAEMVRRLRKNGIKEIVMLTGDAPETARSIAAEAGIKNVHARLLPEEKLEVIKQLRSQGHKVAMVGDGINDAPALAAADIGIAMGVAGTDVAIETADVALMVDDLTKIPEALRISKLTLRNIHQNVVIALITVSALLAGVFAGSVHMAEGMLIHELSVMLVIINGMRLKWIR